MGRARRPLPPPPERCRLLPSTTHLGCCWGCHGWAAALGKAGGRVAGAAGRSDRESGPGSAVWGWQGPGEHCCASERPGRGREQAGLSAAAAARQAQRWPPCERWGMAAPNQIFGVACWTTAMTTAACHECPVGGTRKRGTRQARPLTRPAVLGACAIGSGARPAYPLRSSGTKCNGFLTSLAVGGEAVHPPAEDCGGRSRYRRCRRRRLGGSAAHTQRGAISSCFGHACGAIHEQQRASCGLGSRSGTALDQCARRRRLQGHQWPVSAV